MTRYRTYETIRNAAGGLDSCGTDWQYIEADSAADAAREAAEELRSIPDCRGEIVVATDDDGDSAECEV